MIRRYRHYDSYRDALEKAVWVYSPGPLPEAMMEITPETHGTIVKASELLGSGISPDSSNDTRGRALK